MLNKKIIRIVFPVLIIFSLINFPRKAQSLGMLDALQALDMEQCFLPSYQWVPFGCFPGDLVCHNIPRFVETVQKPFTTAIPFVGSALKIIAGAALGNVGSSGGADSANGARLHFYWTHIYSIPGTIKFLHFMNPLLTLCPDVENPIVNYISELDVLIWQSPAGGAELFSVQGLIGAVASISNICSITGGLSTVGAAIPLPGVLSDICMGTWGVTYPRTGWSNAQTYGVASAIATYRASRVLANSLYPVPRLGVFPPYGIPTPFGGTKMQLIYPHRGSPISCINPGDSPALWDNNPDPTTAVANAAAGEDKIWVVWDKQCCCLPPVADWFGSWFW